MMIMIMMMMIMIMCSGIIMVAVLSMVNNEASSSGDSPLAQLEVKSQETT